MGKKWKLLSDKNENNYMRTTYQPFIDDSSSNQSVSTWIIHPKRTQLSEFEQDLGFKGPLKNIGDALQNHCDDGDRLLIHDGIYDSHIALYTTCKGFHLVGLGKNVLFKNISNGCTHFFIDRNNMKTEFIFENLEFDEAYLRIFGNNKIIIKDCTFRGHKGHALEIGPDLNDFSKNVDVKIDECTFIDAGLGLMEGRVDANVTNCLFKRCIKHSIIIQNISISDTKNTLRCIGNTFEDLQSHPIVECEDENLDLDTSIVYDVVDESDRYLLKDNKLTGNNKYK